MRYSHFLTLGYFNYSSLARCRQISQVMRLFHRRISFFPRGADQCDFVFPTELGAVALKTSSKTSPYFQHHLEASFFQKNEWVKFFQRRNSLGHLCQHTKIKLKSTKLNQTDKIRNLNSSRRVSRIVPPINVNPLPLQIFPLPESIQRKITLDRVDWPRFLIRCGNGGVLIEKEKFDGVDGNKSSWILKGGDYETSKKNKAVGSDESESEPKNSLFWSSNSDEKNSEELESTNLQYGPIFGQPGWLFHVGDNKATVSHRAARLYLSWSQKYMPLWMPIRQFGDGVNLNQTKRGFVTIVEVANYLPSPLKIIYLSKTSFKNSNKTLMQKLNLAKYTRKRKCEEIGSHFELLQYNSEGIYNSTEDECTIEILLEKTKLFGPMVYSMHSTLGEPQIHGVLKISKHVSINHNENGFVIRCLKDINDENVQEYKEVFLSDSDESQEIKYETNILNSRIGKRNQTSVVLGCRGVKVSVDFREQNTVRRYKILVWDPSKIIRKDNEMGQEWNEKYNDDNYDLGPSISTIFEISRDPKTKAVRTTLSYQSIEFIILTRGIHAALRNINTGYMMKISRPFTGKSNIGGTTFMARVPFQF